MGPGRPEKLVRVVPGIGPRLVAAEPPYNAHLATDAGAGFLATGIALAVAALYGRRPALQVALLAYAAFAVPHVAYHATNPAPGLTGVEDLFNVAMLAAGPTLAALFAWGTARAPPFATTVGVAVPPDTEHKGREAACDRG